MFHHIKKNYVRVYVNTVFIYTIACFDDFASRTYKYVLVYRKEEVRTRDFLLCEHCLFGINF